MRRFLGLLLISITLSISAQTEKEEVFEVVKNVFVAMNTSDSLLLKSCFVDEPNFFTVVRNPSGQSELKVGELRRFVQAVGNAKKGSLNEPIWNEKIEIDGDLAQVWVDYAFYFNDQFSHCGVDAFHLIRQDDQWKIFHIVDTRRKSGCDIPENVQKSAKGDQ